MILKMNKPQISRCCAREILDSRGNPTVEATVILNDGTVGVASVPSGASTGAFEAHEKRDADKQRYHGKGVQGAVYNVCKVISPALTGIAITEQAEIDKTMIDLDGTPDKSDLGANAILAVSLAAARAGANSYHMPIYRYLGGVAARRLPVPMCNILNGGAHAGNNIEIQEFMIAPVGAGSFSEAIMLASEIYHNLGNILKEKGHSSAVGDEGGYAPNLSCDEEALDLIMMALERTEVTTDEVKIALDVASSEWYEKGGGNYKMLKSGKEYSADELIKYWEDLCSKYPIFSIEDGLGEEDYSAWQRMTERLGDKIMLVGDDLFVTNTERLREGIKNKIANTILVKPNQIGTLTETLCVIETAKNAGYKFIPSHRSGETEDTTIADISVAVNAEYIKTGAPCRSERVAKYNRLLRIESSLNSGGVYGSDFSVDNLKNRFFNGNR